MGLAVAAGMAPSRRVWLAVMLAVVTQGCRTVTAVSFGVPRSVCEGRMQELACPSQDFDGDGVANAADLCPEEAARTPDGCAGRQG